MNQPTQQFPANPALDFANSILEVTNGGLELIEILHDIAQGVDEDATTNDRIAAANILADRGFGKSPRQISPNPGPTPEPAPETDNNDVEPAPYSIRGAIRESPSAAPHKEPESPRLVTQIKDSLNQSLGPPPSAETQPTPQTPEPFDPYSIHFTIQQHILAITNNGQTLRDTLLEIARGEDGPKACPEPRGRTTPYHRARAARILLDRLLGTAPMSVRSVGSLAPVPDAAKAKPKVRYVDPEALAEARAEIQRMKDEGILTPDPNARKIDISKYRMPKDFDYTPYAKEEAAKFWADIELRLERQKQWPEIEERRRKKLAQIYPSHSDDDELPDP